MSRKRIVIFASGSGTNAEQIVKYFKNHNSIEVIALFTNNAHAGVIDRMSNFNIPSYIFNRQEFINSNVVETELIKLKADYIILAGFLWLVPLHLLRLFNDRIINIHPALLPKYGGKGMYGMNVHNAVLANNESQSGITIHLINEEYDKGRILFQANTEITHSETAATLAEKIHALEHEHFAKVIERFILGDI
ncbi:MAG: phosphoribosylglycinamide formyltransferase [Bacteroidia bacterium]|nr:phosphoribosylglycinamide formyltransferase [Bacteroidota bacterium]MCZ2129086.1 phosphoribosylglycinamide formyltransferase [Bacteroidia bacterium]